jgi:4-amino-4-deoxy-L-arabinose transferase-like glycosyltransferase
MGRVWWGIIGVGLVVRGVMIASAWGDVLPDPDNYVSLARSVAAGEGLRLVGRPTAYRPPLYPLLLAPLAGLAPGELGFSRLILLVNLALGGATVATALAAARRWGLGPRGVAAAGLIVACDPVLVAQARLPMTETLAAFLVSLTLLALAVPRARDAALWGGLASGLAALCRPSLLAPTALVAAAWLVTGPEGWRQRPLRVALFLLATTAMLAPWAVRNARVLGTPVWTTTHGGYTLALGNNPVFYREVVSVGGDTVWQGPGQQAWWDDITRQTAGQNEVAVDRALGQLGWQAIGNQPGLFARASIARVVRLWGLAPAGAVYGWPVRLATAVWSLPLLLGMVAGLLRFSAWRWPGLTAVAFMAGITAVHAVYWTDLRMRAPIVPAIALVVALAIDRRARSVESGK